MSSEPYKQGVADRYYGRKYRPKYEWGYPELEEYKRGWNEEQDRKDWGDGQFAPQQADKE